MEWAEDLPEGCPPPDAVIPNGEIVFRAVLTIPPQPEDFYSQRKKQPNIKVSNECEARGVSVFRTLEGCQRLRKYTYFRNHLIVSLTLDNHCGLIRETIPFTDVGHCNWWLFMNFNPIPICVDAGRVL